MIASCFSDNFKGLHKDQVEKNSTQFQNWRTEMLNFIKRRGAARRQALNKMLKVKVSRY